MTFDPNKKLTRDNFKELPPLCTDGAWGTEMQKHGAQPGQMCDPWNTDEREKVLQVAKAYVDAGSQVILTNTFNSNRVVLDKHGLADKVRDINKAGAEISKEAAQGKAYVFGSIGPCGKIVMMGEVTAEEVDASAQEQAAALQEGGADAIVIETQSDIMEVEALLHGALSGCDLPVGVSLTFDSGSDSTFTMMGVSVPQAYEMAKAYGASFVGANCGVGIESFVALARLFSECGDELPVWVKGNAGMPELDEKGNTIFRATPDLYAETVPKLLEVGAHFIGGCCGSGPDHISAIRQALDAHVQA
jgi:5-methyltetrahydrofolate--homocysteine methyltransferase